MNVVVADGGQLAFHCRHLYEENQLSATEAKLCKGSSTVSNIKLKNEDAVLCLCSIILVVCECSMLGAQVIAVAAASFGCRVSFLRMLSEECCGDTTWLLSEIPKKKDGKGFGCVRTVDGGYRTMTITPDEVNDFADGTLEDQEKNLHWVRPLHCTMASLMYRKQVFEKEARKEFANREYGGVLQPFSGLGHSSGCCDRILW